MKKQVNLLLLYTFFSGFATSVYGVIFNLYLREIGYNNNFIGHMTSFELFGSAVFGSILILFGELLGRKKMLVFSSFASCIVLMLRIAFPIDNILVILALFNGTFNVGRGIFLNTIILDITESGERGQAFGNNAGVMWISGLCGSSIGGVFADFVGFKTALIVSTLLYLLSNIFIVRINTKEIVVKNNDFRKIIKQFNFSDLNKKQKYIFSGYLLNNLLVAFGAGLFIHFGNLIFKDLFDLSATFIGNALAFAQLGAALGSFIAPKLCRKFGAIHFITLFQIIVPFLFLGLASIRDPYMFTALYAIRFTLMNMTGPSINTIVMSILPKNKINVINSLGNFLNNITRAVASSLFGIIVGGTIAGYTTLFLISGIFYVLNIFVFFKFFIPYRKEESINELFIKKG